MEVETDSDSNDSLFGDSLYQNLEEDLLWGKRDESELFIVASGARPPIPGLVYFPFLTLHSDTCSELIQFLQGSYFPQNGENINQIMLFTRPDGALPPILDRLLIQLSEMFLDRIPPYTHRILFSSLRNGRKHARQVILNKYLPGEGITPHVDLLKRFDDGIIGVCLGSGTVMDFRKVGEEGQKCWSLFLPAGSVIGLTGESRFEWTHGIDRRAYDWVAEEGSTIGTSPLYLKRDIRMSITFRWLLPGADVVGGDE